MKIKTFVFAVGKCCHFYANGKINRCRFLVDLPGGITGCQVYETRLGRIIGRNRKNRRIIVCCTRNKAGYNYEGCPYNKEGKPMFDFNKVTIQLKKK